LLPQLLPHPIERPPQYGLIGLFADKHDRREYAQKNIRLITAEDEAAAGEEELAAAIAHGHTARPGGCEDRSGVDGRQAEIAGQQKGMSFGKQETVASLEVNGISHANDRKPALAGHHSIELDAFVQAELERPVLACI
jgi:hypothetical protein